MTKLLGHPMQENLGHPAKISARFARRLFAALLASRHGLTRLTPDFHMGKAKHQVSADGRCIRERKKDAAIAEAGGDREAGGPQGTRN